jgi:5'-3' exonuclease
MSRITQTSEQEEEVVHDNRIKDIITDFSVKEKKIVIADFDSLLYFVAYTGKDENGIKKPEYTEEEYPIAETLLDEAIVNILVKVEEYFEIEALYVAIKGTNNFRYQLLSSYKSNRPPSPPIIRHLANYMMVKHKAVQCENCESDDLCFSISNTIDHQGIILTIDKDFKQIPSILYDYKKDIWIKPSIEESRHHLALQMCMGDSGDSIPGLKGIGPKKAAKIVSQGMSNYQYMKAILKAYKDCYKENGKTQMKMMYHLLKLHNVDELPIKK